MRIDIDSDNLRAAQSNGAYQVDFAEMIIDSNDSALQLRFSTLYQDTSFNNFDDTEVTFNAGGHLLSISTLADNLDAKQNTIDVVLSGLDSTVIGQIDGTTPVIGSPVNLYRGYWNEDTGELISKPFLLWRGIANDFSVAYMGSLGQENTVQITLACKSLLAALLESENGRYTSQEQFLDENDYSMEFVASLTSFNPQFGRD